MNKYTFSAFLENKMVNEVAEYMTGDDPNITLEKHGDHVVSKHKTLGPIISFEYEPMLTAPKIGTTSFDKDKFEKGYIAKIHEIWNTNKDANKANDKITQLKTPLPNLGSEGDSQFLGSVLSSITKFIKEIKPGTINFQYVLYDTNKYVKTLVPLLRRSLKTIAIKNNMVFLNDQIMTENSLKNVAISNPADHIRGLKYQVDQEKEQDKKELEIRRSKINRMNRDPNAKGLGIIGQGGSGFEFSADSGTTPGTAFPTNRTAFKTAKDFVANQRNQFNARKQARAERLNPKTATPEPATPEPAKPELTQKPKNATKSFLDRLLGR